MGDLMRLALPFFRGEDSARDERLTVRLDGCDRGGALAFVFGPDGGVDQARARLVEIRDLLVLDQSLYAIIGADLIARDIRSLRKCELRPNIRVRNHARGIVEIGLKLVFVRRDLYRVGLVRHILSGFDMRDGGDALRLG